MYIGNQIGARFRINNNNLNRRYKDGRETGQSETGGNARPVHPYQDKGVTRSAPLLGEQT